MMTDNNAYPGAYLPSNGKPEYDKLPEASREEYPFEINKLSDGYEILIPLSGIEREDLILHIRESKLYIYYCHTPLQELPAHIHGGNCSHRKPFKLIIPMPEDGDVIRLSAAYVNGVLQIQMPMEKGGAAGISRVIPVY